MAKSVDTFFTFGQDAAA